MTSLLIYFTFVIFFFEAALLVIPDLFKLIPKGLNKISKEIRAMSKSITKTKKDAIAHPENLSKAEIKSKLVVTNVMLLLMENKVILIKALCLISFVVMYFMYCIILLFTKAWPAGIALLIKGFIQDKMKKNKKRNTTRKWVLKYIDVLITISILMWAALKLRGVL